MKSISKLTIPLDGNLKGDKIWQEQKKFSTAHESKLEQTRALLEQKKISPTYTSSKNSPFIAGRFERAVSSKGSMLKVK